MSCGLGSYSLTVGAAGAGGLLGSEEEKRCWSSFGMSTPTAAFTSSLVCSSRVARSPPEALDPEAVPSTVRRST